MQLLFWGVVLASAFALGFASWALGETYLGGDGFQPQVALPAGLIGLLVGVNFAFLAGLIVTVGRRPMTREGTAIATFIVIEVCITLTLTFTWPSMDGSPFIEDVIGSAYLGVWPALALALVSACLPSGFYRSSFPAGSDVTLRKT